MHPLSRYCWYVSSGKKIRGICEHHLSKVVLGTGNMTTASHCPWRECKGTRGTREHDIVMLTVAVMLAFVGCFRRKGLKFASDGEFHLSTTPDPWVPNNKGTRALLFPKCFLLLCSGRGILPLLQVHIEDRTPPKGRERDRRHLHRSRSLR